MDGKLMKRLITAFLIPLLIAVPELAFAQRGVQAIVTQQTSAATAPSVAAVWAVAAYTTLSQTISPTAGQLLVAATTSTGASLVTPSGCGTWTERGTADSQNDAIWSAPVTSSGSCTVSLSNTSTFGGLALWEINTVSQTVDAAANTESYTASPAVGASVTTTVANDLVVGECSASVNTPTYTIISPFINDFNGSSGAITLGMAHYVKVSAGSITPSWTTNESSAWFCSTLAVKP